MCGQSAGGPLTTVYCPASESTVYFQIRTASSGLSELLLLTVYHIIPGLQTEMAHQREILDFQKYLQLSFCLDKLLWEGPAYLASW